MNIYYNSRKKQYKSIFGSIATEQELLFRVYVLDAILDIQLVTNNIELKMHAIGEHIYEVRYVAPLKPQLVFYYFKIITQDNNIVYYGNQENGKGGEGKLYHSPPTPYQLTVYDKNIVAQKNLYGSVIYQIFPDRFYREGPVLSPKKGSVIHGDWNDLPFYIKDKNNDIKSWNFHGGNLDGICKKLPYLKSLGIDIIYLNPIFEARSNHRYDTANYKKIDPMLGDEKSFVELISKAQEMGIKIILDGVFNHTGCDSIYFNKFSTYNSVGAYQEKNSPYFHWYTFEKYPEKYDCWWGVDDLPMVNELNQSYLDYIIYDDDSVINKWMRLGVAGWRLDVADELPDEFIQKFREQCKKNNPDSFLLGEVWEDASNKISYEKRRTYFVENELDSVTNYPLRDWLIAFLSDNLTSKDLYENIMNQFENYPLHNFYINANMLSSHDIERILTTIKNKSDKVLEFLNILVAILMTYPGMPLIYYGDEAGVEGGKDPDNRRTYPWGHENLEILQIYQKYIGIHQQNSVFKTGFFKPFYITDDIFGYIRYFENQKDVAGHEADHSFAIVVVNKNKTEQKKFSIRLFDKAPQNYQNILDENLYENQDGMLTLTLKPLEIKILLSH